MPSFDLVPRADFSSWSNLGCYTDWDVNYRALTDKYVANHNGNTPQSCVNTCSAAGFKYAGVEYGFECFCGNEIRNGAYQVGDGECSMKCSGSNAKCGNGNRINIYFEGNGNNGGGNSPAPLDTYKTWTHDGCYTDLSSARALTQVWPSGAMTPQLCLDTCQAQGFSIAGVEYSSECFCGNALANGHKKADSQASCNMKCDGNNKLLCGGPDRLNVYRSESTTPPTNNPPVDDDECGANEWEVLGCYSDATTRRTLSHQVALDGATIEKCLVACDNAGFSFAGVEYGSECFCGNEIQYGHTLQSSGCNMPCAGNGGQTCGGPDRINLYQFSDSTSFESTVLQTYKSWYSAGCLTDQTWARSLPVQAWPSGGMTVQKCIDSCEGMGATYAGLEYAKECWCGWGIENGGRIVDISDGCSMACEGDDDHLCGGGDRLNLYRKGA